MIFPSLVVLAAPRQGANGLWVLFGQIFIFLVIAYFLIFRPQRKEQERHQQRLDALKKGDEVVTAGGVIGTVLHVEADRLTIRSGESRLVVERSRIAKVLTAKDVVEPPKEAKETLPEPVEEAEEPARRERPREKGRGSRRS